MTLFTFLMLAAVIGGGVYLILSRKLYEVLLGIALFSNGVNLLLIESSQSFTEGVDPLPQALILTAIVIGFGLLSFFAVFTLKYLDKTGTDIVEDLK